MDWSLYRVFERGLAERLYGTSNIRDCPLSSNDTSIGLRDISRQGNLPFYETAVNDIGFGRSIEQ